MRIFAKGFITNPAFPYSKGSHSVNLDAESKSKLDNKCDLRYTTFANKAGHEVH